MFVALFNLTRLRSPLFSFLRSLSLKTRSFLAQLSLRNSHSGQFYSMVRSVLFFLLRLMCPASQVHGSAICYTLAR
jgi:hypothetical protein